MTSKITTYDYMKNFQCTGADCPDSCCSVGWQIGYDKKHYLVLKELMSQQPDTKKIFDENLSLNHSADNKFATIRNLDNGRCSFLQDNQLCHLHSQYGTHCLSNTCAQYPRLLLQLDSKIEMHGILSCPEVTRLYLSRDNASEELAISLDGLPRGDDFHIANNVSTVQGYYYLHFPLVKNLMLEIADNTHHDLDLKLYLLASFSDRLAPLYFRGCKELSAEAIQSEYHQQVEDQTITRLHGLLQKYAAPEPFAIMLIQAILLFRHKHSQDDNFGKLVSSVLGSYDSEIADSAKVNNDIAIFEPHDLWLAYRKRHDKIYNKLGEKIDSYLLKYLTNCIRREWFINLPEPFLYIQMLITRMAMLKFMFISDPKTLALLDSENAQQALEQLAIEHIYSFTRAIDQDVGFLKSIYQVMDEQRYFDIEYTPMFITMH
ncbi:MAG: flagellin lysine-N-methylase [Gammaproteobacteria bacterium]|nr:flagellin lysine-N-methylase [Gammaproteobacteria bacterium]